MRQLKKISSVSFAQGMYYSILSRGVSKVGTAQDQLSRLRLVPILYNRCVDGYQYVGERCRECQRSFVPYYELQPFCLCNTCHNICEISHHDIRSEVLCSTCGKGLFEDAHLTRIFDSVTTRFATKQALRTARRKLSECRICGDRVQELSWYCPSCHSSDFSQLSMKRIAKPALILVGDGQVYERQPFCRCKNCGNYFQITDVEIILETQCKQCHEPLFEEHDIRSLFQHYKTNLARKRGLHRKRNALAHDNCECPTCGHKVDEIPWRCPACNSTDFGQREVFAWSYTLPLQRNVSALEMEVDGEEDRFPELDMPDLGTDEVDDYA